MNPQIFIDTNIFLDFYRFDGSDIHLKYLEQLEKHQTSLILSTKSRWSIKK